MTKKALIFITCATVFSMGVALVTLNGIKETQNFQTGATDTRVVEFYNQGDNLTYDGENHIALYEGNLSDGTPLYMRVSAVSTMGAENSYFVAQTYTNVRFYSEDTCENEYCFQNMTSFTIYHEATLNAIPVTIEKDNVEEITYDFGNITGDGVATSSQFNIPGCRRLGVEFTGNHDLKVNKVSISYTCSYDWVEPTYKTVEIYATNDFHGAIEPDAQNPGLEVWGTYFKKMGQRPNVLLLDQGDTWQGSIYSNINHGNLINDVMCEARWDARTVGNHDFDWGVNAVKVNTARSYGGYTIPTLAANIYDFNFSTKQEGSIQQSDIGGEYVTYTLANGLKVGVIGVIGRDQITSINSIYTEGICFKEHVPIIKSLATELRSEENCDIVICSIHADEDAVRGNNLEDYVDLVLCGHSHQEEDSTEGDLHYYQFSKEGRSAGHITLTHNSKTGKVSTRMDVVTKTNMQTVVTNLGGIDTNIHNLVTAARVEADVEGEEVLASDVLDLPSGGPNVKYLFDKTTTRFYKWSGIDNSWTRIGTVADPSEDTIYYWNDASEKAAGLESLIEDAYYIDVEEGDYYKVISSVLTKQGSFIEDNDPVSTNWYMGFYGAAIFDDNSTLPNLMAKAIYDEAVDEEYDIDLAYVNFGRADIEKSEWKYADIYRSFPFDNTVYVMTVTGKELIDEVMFYNYAYIDPDFDRNVNVNDTYTIACLDYLAFHTNSSRYYDYFPSISGQSPHQLSKNYREILRDWLKDEGYSSGKVLNERFFRSNITEFNRQLNVMTEYQATFMLNYDGAPNEGIYDQYNLKYHDTVAYNLPAWPTRDGYRFAGWYRNQACTQPLGTWFISGDTTFYAKWDAEDNTHDGTLDHPLYVPDALAIAAEHIGSGNKSDPFYCVGIVSYMAQSINGDSGDLNNVTITDCNGNDILIFYLKKFNGANKNNGNFKNISDLPLGTKVLIYGRLYTFNTTPEFASGTYCVKINDVLTAQNLNN